MELQGCFSTVQQHSSEPKFSVKPGFHIVVSVVRKKFIGEIEFYLVQKDVSVISFVLSICTGGFHKVISVL